MNLLVLITALVVVFGGNWLTDRWVRRTRVEAGEPS